MLGSNQRPLPCEVCTPRYIPYDHVRLSGSFMRFPTILWNCSVRRVPARTSPVAVRLQYTRRRLLLISSLLRDQGEVWRLSAEQERRGADQRSSLQDPLPQPLRLSAGNTRVGCRTDFVWHRVAQVLTVTHIKREEASISLLNSSNSGRSAGKNCPIKSGNCSLPPGKVAPQGRGSTWWPNVPRWGG